MNIELLEKNLAQGVVTVRFTKTDGSERLMKATTREDMISYTPSANARPSKPNDRVIKVWDVDINEWRSIRKESVKEFTV